MTRNSNILAYLVLIASLSVIPFLFVKRDVDAAVTLTRSMKHLWDFAHFPLFICITLTCYLFFKPLQRMVFEIRLFYILLFTLLLGAVFEVIQVMVGRYFQWQDIYWDISGAMCAVLLLNYRAPRKYRYSFTMGIMVFIIITAISSIPLTTSLLDEYQARRDFPVLADFSSTLQLGRFSRRSNFTLTDRGLEISLTTGRYSGFSFNYFPRDWSVYNGVKILLHNHESDAILFTCRIHDLEHNQKYEDRFNQVYSVLPGEFVIQINFEDVRIAPKGRILDLTRVRGLICFTSNLIEGKTVTLEKILLYN